MGIQDLGAIGEFISSLVIFFTLLVLVYEMRGAKQATLQANAQERQKARTSYLAFYAESPDLAGISVKANEYLGWSDNIAREFGLEPDQYARLSSHYFRIIGHLRDAYVSQLPEGDEAFRLF